MRIAQIRRYPVKSLQGEDMSWARIEADGLNGDREWAIRDEVTGKVLTGRRAPQLLLARATLTPDGVPVITLPTGDTLHGPGTGTDVALTRWIGRPVSLVSAATTAQAQAESFADATDDTSEVTEWTMPEGRFVDEAPLLVLTKASLRTAAALHPAGDWQVRRFRPNLVIDVQGEGWVEDSWCGRSSLAVGTALLAPQEPCMRCTMVTRPQPGIDEDRDVFRTLARHHGGHIGAWTAAIRGGEVHLDDEVVVGLL